MLCDWHFSCDGYSHMNLVADPNVLSKSIYGRG